MMLLYDREIEECDEKKLKISLYVLRFYVEIRNSLSLRKYDFDYL